MISAHPTSSKRKSTSPLQVVPMISTRSTSPKRTHLSPRPISPRIGSISLRTESTYSTSHLTSHIPHFNNRPIEFYGKIIKKIGAGAYGNVYLTEHNYVFKIIKFTDHLFGDTLREIAYPSSINDQNIIKYHDVYVDTLHPPFSDRFVMDADTSRIHHSRNTVMALKYTVIVMDHMEGDVRQLLINIDLKYNMDMFKHITYQMILAVVYLTSYGILHRDIKTQNFFYDQSSLSEKSVTSKTSVMPRNPVKIVLGDFGLAVGKNCSTIIHDDQLAYTLSYRPPEILLGKRTYDEKADVWALGCCIYEMYTKRFFVETDSFVEHPSNYQSMLMHIFSKTGYPSSTSSLIPELVREFNNDRDLFLQSSGNNNYITIIPKEPLLNDLLKKMLNPSPELRNSIFSLQHHPFFEGIIQYYHPTIESNTCPMRIQLFDRHFTYDNLAGTSKIRNVSYSVATLWMLELKNLYPTDDRILHLAFHIFYEYFNIYPKIPKIKVKLVACGAIFVASQFLLGHWTLRRLSIYSKYTYTEDDIFDISTNIIKALNYDIAITTKYDNIFKFLGVYSLKILHLASTILLLISTQPRYFMLSDLPQQCLSMSLKYYNDEDHTYDHSKIYALKDIFNNKYQNDIALTLFTRTQWEKLKTL